MRNFIENFYHFTGCFADCAQNEDRTNSFDYNYDHEGPTLTMAWSKIGDPNHEYAQNRGVNWRACHHETMSFGCTTGKLRVESELEHDLIRLVQMSLAAGSPSSI